MIRKADIEDFDDILDLCKTFWKETQFNEKFERNHTIEMVAAACSQGLLCVLEVDGSTEGFAAGCKSPSLGSSQAMVGTEIAWWVNPDHRGGGNGIELLKYMEMLAKEQGVKYWSMVSMQSSMPEQVNALYEKMGYKLSEMVYTKVI